MFSLIFSENSFWFIDHLLFSISTSAMLFILSIVKTKFDELRTNKADGYKDNKIFLPAVAIHVFLQFFFNFIYDFSFVDYINRFVFIVFVIELNKKYSLGIKLLTEERINQLEKTSQIITVFALFISFLAILNSQTGNSCGQPLLVIFTFVYVLIGAISCLNSYFNYQAINKSIVEMIGVGENEDVERIEYSHKILESLSENRLFFFQFAIAVVSSCFLYPLLFWLKMFKVNQNKITCYQIFTEHNFLFKFLFSIWEILSLNCINFFVFYHYYFKIRAEFEPEIGFQQRITEEVFESRRSAMIRQDKQNLSPN